MIESDGYCQNHLRRPVRTLELVLYEPSSNNIDLYCIALICERRYQWLSLGEVKITMMEILRRQGRRRTELRRVAEKLRVAMICISPVSIARLAPRRTSHASRTVISVFEVCHLSLNDPCICKGPEILRRFWRCIYTVSLNLAWPCRRCSLAKACFFHVLPLYSPCSLAASSWSRLTSVCSLIALP